ncbi:hypothetical protein PG997_011706 [Apiospora hydei]|uniref:Uncharacterized protein n=1 Tax=Apiospora hydei TaxID=1337664 RepID=A0ABR1VJT0_9PEZI
MAPYTPPTDPSEVALESLSTILSPSCFGHVVGEVSLTVLAWTRDLEIRGCNNAVSVAQNASRATLQGLVITRNSAAYNRISFAIKIRIVEIYVLIVNSYIRVLDHNTKLKSFPIAIQGLTAGPN